MVRIAFYASFNQYRSISNNFFMLKLDKIK
jgi:hypothetical protein